MATSSPQPNAEPSNPLYSAQEHLKSEGWCIIPSVFTPTETSEALSHLWAASATSNQPSHLPYLDPNPSNIRVFYLMALDPLFRTLIAHPTAIAMVQSLLGPSFLISNFTANIARPGSQSMGLHSDQSLVVPEPWNAPWAVNIIWCLHDVYFANGATLFIPGSQNWTSRAQIPENADTLLQPFEAKAGDVIVMDGRLWHTSGANITPDQDRALLFGYYTVPFLRQQVNWTAALSEEIKVTLSEEMREWLGVNITANSNAGKVQTLKYLKDQFLREKI